LPNSAAPQFHVKIRNALQRMNALLRCASIEEGRMTCREGGVPILSHGVELPRPTLLPPDVDASDGQHRDDEAERTDDNAVGMPNTRAICRA